MHFQVYQIVTFVVAFCLAASRILTASKAFWSLMPSWIAGVLPGLVVALPALAEGIAGSQSWTDLTVAFLAAGALLLPGAHSHSVEMKKPDGASGAVVILALLAASATSACGIFGSHGSFWPALSHCAPSPSSLVSQVEDVLLAGGDYEAALKDLAIKDGAGIVECAVTAAVGLLTAKSGKFGASPESGHAAARGKAFLAKVPQ
jgi:hypothetical protein